jgi:hypothetical protein
MLKLSKVKVLGFPSMNSTTEPGKDRSPPNPYPIPVEESVKNQGVIACPAIT